MSYEERQIRDLITSYFALADGQVDDVLDEFEHVVLRGGDWLFRQDDPGDSLYFLVRGRLSVWQDGSIGAGGRRSLLAEIAPGETVGEIALLTGERRTAGIQARRDCLLLRIDHAGFERLCMQHPKLALTMASRIAIRMHHRTTRRPESGLRLVNICLVPLEDTPRIRRFMDELAAALGAVGPTVDLAPATLAGGGAPVGAWTGAGAVPGDLGAWLEEQESRNRFVVYRATAGAPAWSALCQRQADLIVLVGDTGEVPAPHDWTRRLADEQREFTAKRAMVLLHPAGQPIRDTAAWLDGRDVEWHFHVRDDEPDSLQRVCRVLSGTAVGLVLGAGGARGFAHIGAFRALAEAGIPIDWIGGSSIGSIVGGAIAHGWSPQAVFDNCREAFVDHNPFNDYTLPIVSLLAGKKMMEQSERFLSTPIEDLPIPFFCISANLDDGSVNVHDRGPMHKAIQAAAALPVAMPPAVINHRLAVDGATVNSLPVDFMRRLPVRQVIAVKVSSRREFKVDYDEMPSAFKLMYSRWLRLGRRYRVPGLATVLLKSIEIGTIDKVEMLGSQADLLINPSVRGFGMTDVRHFDEIVEVGYEETVRMLAESGFAVIEGDAGYLGAALLPAG